MELQSNVLSSFLSSSLNVELVYILLESISTFSKKQDNENDKAFVVQIKNNVAKDKKLSIAVVEPINEFATSDIIKK